MTLGKTCTTFMMAVKGDTTVEGARRIVDEIIKTIGMTPIFEPAVYEYEGNIGIIYIQPIFESFVAYDAWPIHGGGYITVTSCRDFYADAVMEVVSRAGYEVVDSQFSSLALDRGCLHEAIL